jgi:hypothetical protein
LYYNCTWSDVGPYTGWALGGVSDLEELTKTKHITGVMYSWSGPGRYHVNVNKVLSDVREDCRQ